MQITNGYYLALGVILVLALCLLLRPSGSKDQRPQRKAASAPGNLHYICARCEGQFTHTKRTIGAWQTGTRRFFCNDCHGKWRASHPAKAQNQQDAINPRQAQNARPAAAGMRQAGSVAPRAVDRPVRADSKSGCFGAVLILMAIPVIAIIAAVQSA